MCKTHALKDYFFLLDGNETPLEIPVKIICFSRTCSNQKLVNITSFFMDDLKIQIPKKRNLKTNYPFQHRVSRMFYSHAGSRYCWH